MLPDGSRLRLERSVLVGASTKSSVPCGSRPKQEAASVLSWALTSSKLSLMSVKIGSAENGAVPASAGADTVAGQQLERVTGIEPA